MKLVALIPARAGSKRIPGKNFRPFFGHPLIAYTIDSAKKAGIFSGIYVSSDSEEIGKVAEYYGAEWIKRSAKLAKDNSADIEWIANALAQISCDVFMILRPTSPFRTDETIKRAWGQWRKRGIKAVEPVKQHPSKMWDVFTKRRMEPIEGIQFNHLLPLQKLKKVFIQNGCLEIRSSWDFHGHILNYQPFFTEGYEGFDLNDEIDWITANVLVERHMVPWPKIEKDTIWDFPLK